MHLFRIHSQKSGVAHFAAESEEEGLAIIRRLISFIPQNNMENAPLVECNDPIDRMEDALNQIIPDNPNKPYNVGDIINAIVDNGDFLEIHKNYAKNIIVGFARFDGMSVGIVANNPAPETSSAFSASVPCISKSAPVLTGIKMGSSISFITC